MGKKNKGSQNTNNNQNNKNAKNVKPAPEQTNNVERQNTQGSK